MRQRTALASPGVAPELAGRRHIAYLGYRTYVVLPPSHRSSGESAGRRPTQCSARRIGTRDKYQLFKYRPWCSK